MLGSFRNRQEANLELVKILERMLRHEPDIRFSQALFALGFVDYTFVFDDRYSGEMSGSYMWKDEYNMEPTELFERVRENVVSCGLEKLLSEKVDGQG